MSRRRKSLEQLFEEMRRGEGHYALSAKRVLTHPDRDAHTIVRFLVASSRCFEKNIQKWAHEWFFTWWCPACEISAGLVPNRRLRAQLSIEDTMRAISTMMGNGDCGLYRHLGRLLAQLPLQKQFILFDSLMRLSRRWRLKRQVHQFSLIYLVENFNVPIKNEGAKDLTKMAATILGKPDVYNRHD